MTAAARKKTRKRKASPGRASLIGVVRDGKVRARKIAPQPFAIPHFRMRPGRPTLLSGRAGTMKTLLAEELCQSVAAGRTTVWGGLKLNLDGPVLLLDFEMGPDPSDKRAQSFAAGLDIDLAGLGPRIEAISFPAFSLVNDQEKLFEVCQGKKLCVVDSLRVAMGLLDENDSRFREGLDFLNQVSARTGTLFLVIHHEGLAPNRPRGTTGIVDACDAVINVSEQPDGTLRLASGKATHAPKLRPIELRLVCSGGLDESEMPKAMHFEDMADARREKRLRRCFLEIRKALRAAPEGLGFTALRNELTGDKGDRADSIREAEARGIISRPDGKAGTRRPYTLVERARNGSRHGGDQSDDPAPRPERARTSVRQGRRRKMREIPA